MTEKEAAEKLNALVEEACPRLRLKFVESNITGDRAKKLKFRTEPEPSVISKIIITDHIQLSVREAERERVDGYLLKKRALACFYRIKVLAESEIERLEA